MFKFVIFSVSLLLYLMLLLLFSSYTCKATRIALLFNVCYTNKVALTIMVGNAHCQKVWITVSSAQSFVSLSKSEVKEFIFVFW